MHALTASQCCWHSWLQLSAGTACLQHVVQPVLCYEHATRLHVSLHSQAARGPSSADYDPLRSEVVPCFVSTPAIVLVGANNSWHLCCQHHALQEETVVVGPMYLDSAPCNRSCEQCSYNTEGTTWICSAQGCAAQRSRRTHYDTLTATGVPGG